MHTVLPWQTGPTQGGFFPGHGAPTKAEPRFVLLGGIEIPVATTEREMIRPRQHSFGARNQREIARFEGKKRHNILKPAILTAG
jgi:hypothetical protein